MADDEEAKCVECILGEDETVPELLKCIQGRGLHAYAHYTLWTFQRFSKMLEGNPTYTDHEQKLYQLPYKKGPVNVIAFKTQFAYNSLVKDLHLPNKIILGNGCSGINDWIKNQTWCYWFVALEEEFKKKMNEKVRLHCPYYRAKQLLGLNPKWKNKWVFRMSIPKEDLFRPCLGKCSEDKLLKDKQLKDIEEWARRWWALSYQNMNSEVAPDSWGVPFSGMGYTIDWSDG